MDPTLTPDGEKDAARAGAWRVARWLVTVAAALLLVTLYLAQTTNTEAAAPPVQSDDTAVYHEMAAPCPAGYNCAANSCIGGNFYFCSYNLAFLGYNYGTGVGCALGNLSCNVSYVNAAIVNPQWVGGNWIGPNWWGGDWVGGNWINGNWVGPNWVGANYCPSGNFTACNANNPWWWNGNWYPWLGTGNIPANANIIAPSGNLITVGPPYRVKEVSAPVATTPAPVAQTAAPAAPSAPTANVITALGAPDNAAPAAPAGGGANQIHALAADPVTTPAAVLIPDDHR